MSNAIAKLLQPSCVLMNCDFKSSEEVIQAIGAAIDREATLPTGLPLGGKVNAAIPHTEIEHVLKPALGMATMKNEVNFRNMVSPTESVPVRLVFLLALEQPKAQIEMLQEVAGVLQNADLVERLVSITEYTELIKTLEGT